MNIPEKISVLKKKKYCELVEDNSNGLYFFVLKDDPFGF